MPLQGLGSYFSFCHTWCNLQHLHFKCPLFKKTKNTHTKNPQNSALIVHYLNGKRRCLWCFWSTRWGVSLVTLQINRFQPDHYVLVLHLNSMITIYRSTVGCNCWKLQNVVHQATGEPERVSFQIMLQTSGHSSHFPFGSYPLICLLAFTFAWSWLFFSSDIPI